MRHEEREREGIPSTGGAHRSRAPVNPSTTVFVANVSPHTVYYCGNSSRGNDDVVTSQLDYNVTWQKLKDVFKVAGEILKISGKPFGSHTHTHTHTHTQG